MDIRPTGVTALERQQLLVVQRTTFWHRVRFGIVRRVARRIDASTVVDIGAGSGMLGDWLRVAHPTMEYRYAESSPALVEGLRARFGPEHETAIGASLPPRCVVAVLDVIEHINDDVAALAALGSSLDSSSRVVVTVPAMPSLFSPWDTALGHHRRYTRRSLRRSIEAAGLRVESITYLFPELLPIAVLRRSRPADGSTADFPSIPAWIDRLAGAVAAVSAALRRLWPAGTSLVAVAAAGSGD